MQRHACQTIQNNWYQEKHAISLINLQIKKEIFILVGEIDVSIRMSDVAFRTSLASQCEIMIEMFLTFPLDTT